MNEEHGPIFVSVTDEDGVTSELEYLDTLELNGVKYNAYFPVVYADENGQEIENEDDGLILLRVIEENGEDILATIDDEDELMMVYEAFMEVLFDDEEDDE